jgi:hypothetical protein
MHSKRKGNIGQLETACLFAKYQWSVFTEQGDVSKIDIIAEKDGHLLKVQCKATLPKNGTLQLHVRKCGPSYVYHYKETDCDFFSLYDLENDRLYLVPSKLACSRETQINLRINPTKNGQDMNILFADEFAAERILRDYTNGILMRNGKDDDIVQTTNSEMSASES